ncbi:protein of unknown function [Butyrivibrio proteoclasticus]|uniref:LTD domain-containing protein n=1 Tax=Butyrivibrio proteoclasticus TaxID=43305 RepID=A0A1I5WRI3_9FIRM|nr:DUF4214 domain-containing protein [Butyrivibrio proteoclasticus]SFQ22191.1 protein of unknown function [Butyrivibrio proteoclasticus]
MKIKKLWLGILTFGLAIFISMTPDIVAVAEEAQTLENALDEDEQSVTEEDLDGDEQPATEEDLDGDEQPATEEDADEVTAEETDTENQYGGLPCSQHLHVIINQIYGTGNKDARVSHSFIELYNPTDAAVNMSGWSIYYMSSSDGNANEWEKLVLTGIIDAHCSYLIRCAAIDDTSSVKYNIDSYDQTWEQHLFNKGLCVVLCSGSDDISADVETIDGMPVIDTYVDMLAVAGGDKAKNQPAYFESAYKSGQSKNKSIRRVAFSDTDSNDADTEICDYSADDCQDFRPRSGQDGAWYAATINFNKVSGFYSDPFDLTLENTSGVGRIYYTLDCSTPDPAKGNGIWYEGAIRITDATGNPNIYSMRTDTSLAYENGFPETPKGGVPKVPDYNIDKSTVLRAAVFSDSGEQISDIYTNSYFVGMLGRASLTNQYTVSITCEPDDLFGYDDGIYVLGATNGEDGVTADDWRYSQANYTNKGIEWEKRGLICIYDESGSPLLSQVCGVRIKGSSSRAYSQKSFNLYSRDEYDGNKRFKYDLFNTGKGPKRMTLFSGAHDIACKFNDYLVSEVCCAEENFDVFNMIPCALFLNGEYWGMYFLTDKYDDKYIEDKYGVKDDNVVMVKNGSIEEGDSEDITLWNQMRAFIENNDMEDEENYKKACELIDIDSFIRYYATEIYISNRDWPDNNTSAWRVRETSDKAYEDGKWRWMLFDVNCATMERASFDSIKWTKDRDPLFAGLMRNQHFRTKFSETILQIERDYFSSNEIDQIIDKFQADYTNGLKESYKRFYGAESFEEEYESTINERRDFFNRRADAINKYLQQHMDNAFLIYSDPVQAFVARMYYYVLQRQPEEEGLNDWTQQLKKHEIDGADFSAGVFMSQEYIAQDDTDEEFIEKLYSTILDREPDDSGMDYWKRMLRRGYSRAYVLRGFANSDEFSAVCSVYDIERGSLELTEDDYELEEAGQQIDEEKVRNYVTRLYAKILGRTPDETGFEYWIDRIITRMESAASVAKKGFFESQEYVEKNKSDGEFVEDCYRSLLDREPEDEGYDYWVNKLSSGKMTRAEVIQQGFGCSREFEALMREYGFLSD